MTQLDALRIVRELRIAGRVFDTGEPPRYNVAPTDLVAVVRVRAPGAARDLDRLRWGLVPSFAKDRTGAARLINARVETVDTKPSFRGLLTSRRCLVVADGFYEWQARGKVKQAFYLRRRDGGLLAMAGLWDRWMSPEGEIVETVTVITKPADARVSSIHDRMPGILEEAHHEAWLTPTALFGDALRELVLSPSPEVQATAVASHVNRVGNDGPACIAPVDDVGTLFDRKPRA
jgi:putative SOS response-associated peptidase YedK